MFLGSSKRKALGAALLGAGVVLGALAVAVPAGASTTASETITAGTITLTPCSSVTFTGVTLTGVNQTTTAACAILVSDATGSGAGWQLQATSTQFASGGHTLATTATTIAAGGITDACAASVTCTVSTPQSAYTTTVYPLPAAASAPVATPFYDATSGTGMGNQNVTPTFTVAIPGNTVGTGAFTSVWTISDISGP